MGELSYAAPRVLAAARRETATAFAFGAVSVGALGAAHGGYFASSWGWAIVAAVAALAWAVTTRDVFRPSPLEVVYASGLAAVAAWFALSSLWGLGAQAIDEAARALVYVAVVGCSLAVVRRGSATALVGGLLAGTATVAAFALVTRMFPDRIGAFDSVAAYRLATPVGYWNALGLLCALALLLALALAVSSNSPVRAALAAAPAPVFAAALYFTFSRGSWVALAIGLAVAFALAPRRLRLSAVALALGVPCAVGIIVGSRSVALTHQLATIARAARDGHRLALLILLLVPAAALLAAVVVVLGQRVAVSALAERVYAVALALAVVAAIVAGVVRYGGPVSAVRRGWDSFAASPPKSQVDLRKRLFNFSSNGRLDLWRAAMNDFEAHPLAGGGAGSYESYWLRHRTTPLKVRDAHSLYLETLAESGVVGLTLLAVALFVPLIAAVRTRRRPFVAVATGAYVAFLVHAAVDWDWEITSVTLAGLLVGVALLAGARSDPQRPLSSRVRYGVLAVALALGAFGFVFLVGNMFLSRATAAASSGRWTAAVSDAKRASTWLAWSTEPWRQLGEAQLAQGNPRAAQRSFEQAIGKDVRDWNAWLDLARASPAAQQKQALAEAEQLNPLSPELAEFTQELGNNGGISIGVGR